MTHGDNDLYKLHLDPALHAAQVLPKGWGTDPLSGYLEQAHRNRFATYFNLPPAYNKLVQVDDAFLDLFKEWKDEEHLLSSLLLIRGHSAFRAACDLGMATCATDAFPAIRACLEYAGYAFAIVRDTTAGDTWLNRHDDAATLRAVKARFTVRNVREAIEREDADVAKRFDAFYDRSIDFGAHPNLHGFSASLRIVENEGDHRFEQAYFQGGSLAAQHALGCIAQTALCALEVAQLAFPTRFAATGVARKVLGLKGLLYPQPAQSSPI